MDLAVILGVVGVVAFIILILVIRWLVLACAFACVEQLCSWCCIWCLVICCANKKDNNDLESTNQDDEEILEESTDYAIFTTQPASTNLYSNNNNEQFYIYNQNVNVKQQGLDQNWNYNSGRPNGGQYQFNQKGMNRFQLNSPSPLKSHGHGQWTGRQAYEKDGSQQSFHQNFSFNQQNHNNNYGQRSFNPNYQNHFYPTQPYTTRSSNGYDQQATTHQVFVIPDQHSVNPLFVHKN